MEKPVKQGMSTVTKRRVAADGEKQEAGLDKAKEDSSGGRTGGCISTWLSSAGLPFLRRPSLPDCFFYEGSVPSNKWLWRKANVKTGPGAISSTAV